MPTMAPKPTDTTRELRIPLPDILRRTALEYVIASKRLRRHMKSMPAGNVQTKVQEALIRALAAAEVLNAQARVIQDNWPTKARLVQEDIE